MPNDSLYIPQMRKLSIIQTDKKSFAWRFTCFLSPEEKERLLSEFTRVREEGQEILNDRLAELKAQFPGLDPSEPELSSVN